MYFSKVFDIIFYIELLYIIKKINCGGYMKVKINACNQDLEIHLEEYGKNNKGMPILFVHGIPTNARLWRHVQKKFRR